MEFNQSVLDLIHYCTRLKQIPIEIAQSDDYRKRMLQTRAPGGTLTLEDSNAIYEEYLIMLRKKEEEAEARVMMEEAKQFLGIHLRAFEGAKLVFPYESNGQSLKYYLIYIDDKEEVQFST
jgi:hypothetical protein